METTQKKIWLGVGTLLAAFGASLCCILPVAVAILGVGSAALGAKIEPYWPYFIGLTAVFFGLAFHRAYRPGKEECAPGESCAVPQNRHRQRVVLWVVAILALILITFPFYVNWVF